MSLDPYTPGFIEPRPDFVASQGNYRSLFDPELTKYLPYNEQQNLFKVLQDESLVGFLKANAQTAPFASDKIIWAEKGRLRVAHEDVTISGTTFTFADEESESGEYNHGIRPGNYVIVTDSNSRALGYVESTTNDTAEIYNMEGTDWTAFPGSVFVFTSGGEWGKGTDQPSDALEPDYTIYDNKPVIFKDTYSRDGSDIVSKVWFQDANGEVFWHLEGERDTELRYQDELEKLFVLAKKSTTASAAHSYAKGTEGLFAAVQDRGNVFTGQIENLTDMDNIIKRLNKQNGERANLIYETLDQSLTFDDMLAGVSPNVDGDTNWGIFQNGKDMALNLGFKGFSRGTYDFFHQQWKLLNDPTGLGNDNVADAVKTHFMIIPFGDAPVANPIEANRIERVPYLTLMYRAGFGYSREAERFVLGSANIRPATNGMDNMSIEFRCEKALRVVGARRFVIGQGASV